MEFVGEKKADPERERKRGKSVVRTVPPKVDAVQDVATAPPQVAAAPIQVAAMQVAAVQGAGAFCRVLDDSDESSDDPDKDHIRVQMLRVKIETERLVRYQTQYALKKEMQKKKR